MTDDMSDPRTVTGRLFARAHRQYRQTVLEIEAAAARIERESRKIEDAARADLAAQIEQAALDEPTLTRILNRLAPIVGGDLLTGGVKHRIGLSSAIVAELAAIRSAAPVEPE